MTPQVDCHIIGTSPWIQQCLASVDCEPVEIHRVSAVAGSTGQARAMGFSQGERPLVTFVDPDDEIVSGAIKACVEALSGRPDAVGAYTDEVLIDSTGRHIRNGKSTWAGEWSRRWQIAHIGGVHHLTVMRRELVERYIGVLAGWHVLELYQLYVALARHGPWVHVPIVGYRWRQHPGGIHRSATDGMILSAVRNAARFAGAVRG